MPRTIATATTVELAELIDFLKPRHRMILQTVRANGSPQLSPVTAGIDELGRIVIATYPGRAKVVNARRIPTVSVCVLSDEWNGPWVQVDGTAAVLDMPDAEDALVDYFRSIAGEHSDWDEYRAAMRIQGKSLIRITPTSWGPLATGGFPQDVADRLDAGEG
ncbi:PPOX class F420-dependent oxidoreductase [Gordonia sp. TBRC 11910]|uniref:PPOX class F420-dependent oxidoreductase n=1 Tax=Gordonia asplenii TaxID=2725283 RepID=A0A848KVY1_9ACTN|nr:PPOX class F420-dependent oxidoreductase [Gordonia asplenii]NMO00341.1 PPOX class F420-dependent oxidoreductase [Gordonia asplenii]